MKLEVVIATYERPEPLRRTLAALARQTTAGFGVAIIDDCSHRPVKSWLETSGYPFPVRILSTDTNSGPARARNLGVATSSAELIAFVDDDVVPERNLLEAHLSALESAGPHPVSIGPLKAPADWRPTPWNRWEAATLEVEYQRMMNGVYAATWRQFFTGNAMLLRADFQSAGGFDPAFKRAEDIEFAYRLHRRGARFVFEPKAIGWHYANRSLESWRRMAAQYAEFDLAIDRLHPELGWRRIVTSESKRRASATRFVERVARAAGLERPTASAVIATARGVHAAGAWPLSNKLLSLAFQLEYGTSFRTLDRKQGFNPASTAHA